jgi:hypothetical protein
MAAHSDSMEPQESVGMPSRARNTSSSPAHFLVLCNGVSSANTTNFRLRIVMVKVMVDLLLLSHSIKI